MFHRIAPRKDTVDLWDLTRLLYRRWYVALPMLLVSVAVVLVASRSVQPDYSASGHMVLIPPRGPAETAPGVEPAKIRNPWNELGFQALGQAAIIKVEDKKVLDGLKAGGFTPNITVTIDYRTPVFVIEAVGTSPEQATGTVRQVMMLLDKEVLTAQSEYAVTQQDLITTLALDHGDQVTAVTSKVKRVLIVAFGIGLLVTAAATIGADALLRRRARRLEGETEPRTRDRLSEQRGPQSSAGPQPADAAAEATARTTLGRDAPPSDAAALETWAFETRRRETSPPASVPASETTGQDTSAGQVFRSASATSEGRRADGVADGPSAGGNGAGGGRSRANAVAERVGLTVEYTLRDGESRREGGAAPSERVHDPDVSADSPDATVILPLSHGNWGPRDDGGKRR